jgi:NTP pyrophosphatase (non-canonical NTP hydrolase)
VTRLNSTGAQQMKPDHDELTRRLIEFRDERDWRQFHSLKNLIMSAAMEAAEIMELTQWKDDEALESAAQGDTQFRAALAEECADVFLYLLFDLRTRRHRPDRGRDVENRAQRPQISGRQGERKRQKIYRSVRRRFRWPDAESVGGFRQPGGLWNFSHARRLERA